MKKPIATCLLAASALLLGGCYESTDVTLHEPQVYKGEKDPLLAQAGDRQEELRKRFQLVQMDR